MIGYSPPTYHPHTAPIWKSQIGLLTPFTTVFYNTIVFCQSRAERQYGGGRGVVVKDDWVIYNLGPSSTMRKVRISVSIVTALAGVW